MGLLADHVVAAAIGAWAPYPPRTLHAISARSAILNCKPWIPGFASVPDPFGSKLFSAAGARVVVYAFDRLHLNGRDLGHPPFIERAQPALLSVVRGGATEFALELRPARAHTAFAACHVA
jgi:ATP-dependent DNA ligase